MAASAPQDVSVKTMDEEITSTVENDRCPVSDNGGTDQIKDFQNKPETVEPFKKPAIFAAPSVASRRGNVPSSSKLTTPETVKESNNAETVTTTGSTSSSEPENERNCTEKRQEGGRKCDKDTSASSVKTKSDVKPRVLPAKGPPAGNFPPIPYTEPPWGGTASDIPYALEILKNGGIVDTIPLTDRSYFVVGRLPVCDVSLEHPSISRYHAVIQYRPQSGEGEAVGEERGFYVHDLGSTHGTVVNKNKIPPKTYIRLRVGHVLKFGGSTRLFILQVSEGVEPLYQTNIELYWSHPEEIQILKPLTEQYTVQTNVLYCMYLLTINECR